MNGMLSTNMTCAWSPRDRSVGRTGCERDKVPCIFVESELIASGIHVSIEGTGLPDAADVVGNACRNKETSVQDEFGGDAHECTEYGKLIQNDQSERSVRTIRHVRCET